MSILGVLGIVVLSGGISLVSVSLSVPSRNTVGNGGGERLFLLCILGLVINFSVVLVGLVEPQPYRDALIKGDLLLLLGTLLLLCVIRGIKFLVEYVNNKKKEELARRKQALEDLRLAELQALKDLCSAEGHLMNESGCVCGRCGWTNHDYKATHSETDTYITEYEGWSQTLSCVTTTTITTTYVCKKCGHSYDEIEDIQ